ncbi:MAG: peptigoglycan-binding protein LysM [Pseudomonadales bacterium]|nr:MAG: peptigoglycan-binding protein LysM [Pseudomonadales bacterium]
MPMMKPTIQLKSTTQSVQSPLLRLPTITMLATILVTTIATTALSGCASNQLDHNPKPTIVYNKRGVPSHYKVRSGDTLSTIAKKYGLNYRTLGVKNGLDDKYTIYAGQWIKLWDSSSRADKKFKKAVQQQKVQRNIIKANANSNSTNNNSTDSNSTNNSSNSSQAYYYPTTNPIMRGFGSGSEGLWFSGRKGDPVYASQNGTVIYSGGGLAEFGKLVMIRHNNELISAYAHNSRLLVPEGSFVYRGQKIAEMGSTGDIDRVGLQLQIRQNGTPINPIEILGNR